MMRGFEGILFVLGLCCLAVTAHAIDPVGGSLGGVADALGAAEEAAGTAKEVSGNSQKAAASAKDTAARAEDGALGNLVSMLTDKLGITEKQATGGAGSVFSVAKDNMSASDFAQVESAVPDMGSLLGAAPKPSAIGGGLAAAAGALGARGSVAPMAKLTGMISQLGMDAGVVGQFISIVLAYLQSQGGNSVSSLVSSALQFGG